MKKGLTMTTIDWTQPLETKCGIPCKLEEDSAADRRMVLIQGDYISPDAPHSAAGSDNVGYRVWFYNEDGTSNPWLPNLRNRQTDTVNHADMVRALVKPGADIAAALTPDQADMWHMASCIPGEAGELFDAVKKHVIYGKDLDRENVVEELGDLEFYMEGLRQRLGITRQETIDANIAKLSVRYRGLRYSDKAARDRADKA